MNKTASYYVAIVVEELQNQEQSGETESLPSRPRK